MMTNNTLHNDSGELNISITTIESLIQSQQQLIPIVTFKNNVDCTSIIPPMVHALLNNGIQIIEITLRNNSGYAAIEFTKTHFPDMMICAGTVTKQEQIIRVKEAGADMIITPGINTTLITRCEANNMAILPGISTASDVLIGIEHGLRHFKFFPAEAAGGTDYLKALQGPFPDIKFCATGGINQQNMADYLALDNVFAIGSSQLTPSHSLQF